MTAWSGTAWYGNGTTVKIATVEITHGVAEVTGNRNPVRRKILNCKNAPYGLNEVIMDTASGTVKGQLDKGGAFPDVTLDSVALEIDSTTNGGFYFSGNVEISDFEISYGADIEKVAEYSFKWQTTDESFTFAKAKA